MVAPGAPSAAKSEDTAERRLTSRDVEVRHARFRTGLTMPILGIDARRPALAFSWAVLALGSRDGVRLCWTDVYAMTITPAVAQIRELRKQLAEAADALSSAERKTQVAQAKAQVRAANPSVLCPIPDELIDPSGRCPTGAIGRHRSARGGLGGGAPGAGGPSGPLPRLLGDAADRHTTALLAELH